MNSEITQDQLTLFNSIDMFISCLYSFSHAVAPYYVFCGNANTFNNPTLSRDIKKVIEDFHSYFYKDNNIKHMNTGNFEGMSNNYGDGQLPLGDIMRELKHSACIRTIVLYVFNSYMHKKEALGLFTYEPCKNKNLEMYYDMNAV